MPTKTRILALTAALSALTPVAFAGQVTLNFDEYSSVEAPLAVETLAGLQFQGAYGYGESMLNRQDPLNLDRASESRGGFVLNKQRGENSTDIIITLVQDAAARSATPALFFESIAFRLWTNGTTPEGGTNPNMLIATGVNGDKSVELTGGGNGLWTQAVTSYTFDTADLVTSLRFTVGGAALALDDMVVTVSDARSPGTNVPEPASFGLVGLALLGAGAASRRKQRG